MNKCAEGLRYSPRDLLNYLDCTTVSWMDRLYLERPGELTPDKTSGFVEMIQAFGLEHEALFLKDVRALYGDVLDLSRKPAEATIAAMQAGIPVIYQATLALDLCQGIADFLVRVEGTSSLGAFHYEIWDAKLAREPKPHYLVQLCCYAEMLESIQGILPREVCVADRSRELRRFRTDDFFYYYLELKSSFLKFQKAFDPDVPPFITGNEDFGCWETYIQARLEAEDALCRTANITGLQIRKLLNADVTTMGMLAERSLPVRRMASKTLRKLQLQARLQIESKGAAVPVYSMISADPACPRQGLAMLPPAAPGDIFFDIEGYPLYDGGLEYLLGASYREADGLSFRAWWAHNRMEEQASFESFITWVHERWQADPQLHVYHYAPYETSALKRLVRVHHYGCSDKLDDLLRNEVFVDLYQVVRQAIVIGEPRYSLKNIEHLYRGGRSGGVTTAGDSIVEYATWMNSGESSDPEESPILSAIRDYNRIDCESTAELAAWLWRLQRSNGIEYVPPTRPTQNETAERVPSEAERLAMELLQDLSGAETDFSEAQALQQLLGYLSQFHKREEKPIWWQHFAWLKATEQELVDDVDCLGDLTRTERAPYTLPRGRSLVYEYHFDPDQDTRLGLDCACYLTHDGTKATIKELDCVIGRVCIAIGKAKPAPPSRAGLLPDKHVSAKIIEDSILATVLKWRSSGKLPSALEDLLLRRAPRIAGLPPGAPLIAEGADLVQSTTDIVKAMQATTLCIQGPPGTGKTYTAARAIVALVSQGKRVGISANSHKAILNLEREVAAVATECGLPLRGLHVGTTVDAAELPPGFAGGQPEGDSLPDVIGGTAWAFSAPILEGTLSHLFIDEAGQVCLANIVGMSRATANIVLVGDQMQLSQPTQAVHPGASGQSALEYLLNEHSTIPAEFGIFLDTSHRMHPKLCSFISETSYDGRLRSHPSTAERYLIPTGAQHIHKNSGLLYSTVTHFGNSQCSEEEVERVAELVDELIGGSIRYRDGQTERLLTLNEILIIAPYNMQVRLLSDRLPGARIASVDKFQGQEAAVIIYSMCASSAGDAPRGTEFLFSRNRTNVALSRARSLAIVVGSLALCRVSCNSIEQMKLVNLYCRIVTNGQQLHSEQRA